MLIYCCLKPKEGNTLKDVIEIGFGDNTQYEIEDGFKHEFTIPSNRTVRAIELAEYQLVVDAMVQKKHKYYVLEMMRNLLLWGNTKRAIDECCTCS